MATIVEVYAGKSTSPLIACDFSPPRSGDPAFVEEAARLDADFICVAYSPGRAVRMDSITAAALIKRDVGKDVIFNFSSRDTNRLAAQMHLLGAQAMGLENVLVLQGDKLTTKDLSRMQDVNDFKPTELVRSIQQMNHANDFKGLKLLSPTQFCIGVTADLDRELEAEARLTHRKIEAGAQFLVTQAIYSADRVGSFHRQYMTISGTELTLPILYGVQIVVQGGLFFGELPESIRRELEAGKSGSAIAIDLARSLLEAGANALYIIPPIMKGGDRDYATAGDVIRVLRGG